MNQINNILVNADILLVDDTVENLQLLTNILRTKGCRVRGAISGQLALVSVAKQIPDLIILDIKMPVMNGFEVCKELKSKTEWRDIPVIFISALDAANDKARAFEAGGVDFITKPFQAIEVLARISTQLRLQAHSREVQRHVAILNDYKRAMDTANMVAKTDINGIITYVNDIFVETFQYSRKELIGKSFNIIRDSETSQSTFRYLWNTILSGDAWQGLLINRRKDGQRVYLEATIVPIHDANHEIREFIAAYVEVTRYVHQEELLHEQTTDSLTGLPNRTKLLQDIKMVKAPMLAMINIQEFKAINDFFGLEHGDSVLIETAERLKSIGGKKASIYRIAADRFSVFPINNKSKDDFISLVTEMLTRLETEPLFCADQELSIRCNAGLSLTGSTVYINADLAMTQAKKERKSFLIYNEEMHNAAHYKENILWTHRLKVALEEQRIVAHYQPIIDNSNGKIVKHEALVRMLDEDSNAIPPSEFLEVSKHTRHYANLTQAVIRQSIAELKNYQGSITINLTIEDIRNEETINFLIDQLRQPDISQRVVLEFTETEGIENYQEVATFVSTMKDLGCMLAIDDFGSGYSNFVYLLELKADFVKVDGSIIKNIVHDNDARILTRVIVDLARELNMRTIAEFVSSREIYKTVTDLGVDFSQGYYFGQPKPGLTIGLPPV
ncbi:MAG: EAL domain-containing protein [Candidatus Thiodiazotropha endolucinida]